MKRTVRNTVKSLMTLLTVSCLSIASWGLVLDLDESVGWEPKDWKGDWGGQWSSVQIPGPS